VHYLALTFSTLLSSQVSGAHRAGLLGPGLGQLIYIRSAITPSQIGASPSLRRHEPRRGEPLRGARLSRDGLGFYESAAVASCYCVPHLART
jgi:hypothetical protein